MLNNTRFLKTVRCQNDDPAPPVWLMRQAGRYMSSYRALRARHSFEQLCLIPDLAAEVTLQPITAFDFDAAILFSDILYPLSCLGVQPQFPEGRGPQLLGPPWQQLQAPREYTGELQGRIPGVYQAVRQLVRALDRPLIGFSGAPWTLAAYLIEGGSSSTWASIPKALEDPRLDWLIAALEDLVVAHLNLQISAGCSAVQIFDSRAHLLPPERQLSLSIRPIQRVLARLSPCPTIVYAVDRPIGSQAISCAASVDLSTIRASVPFPTAIQGNMDPAFLREPDAVMVQQIRAICCCMKNDPGFIFNLSGGVPPETSEDTIRTLVDTVRNSWNTV